MRDLSGSHDRSSSTALPGERAIRRKTRSAASFDAHRAVLIIALSPGSAVDEVSLRRDGVKQ